MQVYLPYLFVIFFFAVPLAGVVAIGYYIYADARSRNSATPVLWSVFVLTLLFPYLVYALLRDERRTDRTLTERHSLAVGVSALISVVGGSLASSPDPLNLSVYVLGFFALSLPVAYLVVVRHEVPADQPRSSTAG